MFNTEGSCNDDMSCSFSKMPHHVKHKYQNLIFLLRFSFFHMNMQVHDNVAINFWLEKVDINFCDFLIEIRYPTIDEALGL